MSVFCMLVVCVCLRLSTDEWKIENGKWKMENYGVSATQKFINTRTAGAPKFSIDQASLALKCSRSA